MTTQPSSHVSWTKLWTVIGILFVPAFGGLIMVSRGAQTIIDNQAVQSISINDIKTDVKQVKDDLKQLHTQVDTISHRQEINNITNNYRYQLQQAKTHGFVGERRDRYGNIALTK